MEGPFKRRVRSAIEEARHGSVNLRAGQALLAQAHDGQQGKTEDHGDAGAIIAAEPVQEGLHG
ncbi:MAG: hypothetical protein HEQ16_09985 [Bosea sp.]|jgi:hypothetical protein|nr:hypothetical protein [Bosea sp. (in: a-proteobacteria)]